MKSKETVILGYLLLFASTVIFQFINGHSFELTLYGLIFSLMAMLMIIWQELCNIKDKL